MLPLLYRSLTRPLAPLATAYLAQRRRRGKEHPVRLPERRGLSSQPRPPGPLAWVHAASVGEATAMLALIERLLQERPGLEILVTTGTVSSAGLLENTLPARARHQFVPVDLPQWIARFLDHWRPDLALWVEIGAVAQPRAGDPSPGDPDGFGQRQVVGTVLCRVAAVAGAGRPGPWRLRSVPGSG